MLFYWVDDPRVLLGLDTPRERPGGDTSTGEDTGQEQASPGG